MVESIGFYNYIKDRFTREYDALLFNESIKEYRLEFYDNYGSFREDDEIGEYIQDIRPSLTHTVISDLGGNITDNPNYLHYYKTFMITSAIPLTAKDDFEKLYSAIIEECKTYTDTIDNDDFEITIVNNYDLGSKYNYNGESYINISFVITFNYLGDILTGQNIVLHIDSEKVYFNSINIDDTYNVEASLIVENEQKYVNTNTVSTLSFSCLYNSKNGFIKKLVNQLNTRVPVKYTVEIDTLINDEDDSIAKMNSTDTMIITNVSRAISQTGLISFTISMALADTDI